MNYKPHKGNSFAALLLSVTLLLGFLPAASRHSAQLPTSTSTEWVTNKIASTRAVDYRQFKNGFVGNKIVGACNRSEYVFRLTFLKHKIATCFLEIRQRSAITLLLVRHLPLTSDYTSKESLPFIV